MPEVGGDRQCANHRHGRTYGDLWLDRLGRQASGRPVVAVGEGDVSEGVLDGVTGYLTLLAPNVFADQLNAFLRSPDLRQRFSAAGGPDVEKHWRWKASVKTLEEQFAP